MRAIICCGVRAARLALMLLLFTAPLAAEERAARLDVLMEALRIEDTVAIMREEGLVHAGRVVDAMLPEADRPALRAQASRLYDPPRMARLVEQGVRGGLDDVDLKPILDFYTSPTGRRVVELELAARRQFLDPKAEEAARAAAADALATPGGSQSALLEDITRLIDSGDLVERNVAASLNADMMFWRGVIDAGGPGPGGEDGDLPSVVAADLEETRRDTAEWITAFLLIACEPLTPAQMDDYADFYETREGRALNAALFAGFNAMYDQLAYLLGTAVGMMLTSARL